MKLKTHAGIFIALFLILQSDSYPTLAQDQDNNKEWQTMHQQVMVFYTKGLSEEAIEEATNSLKFAQKISEKNTQTQQVVLIC